ncbi:MAG TPA: hypothetical protein VF140_07235 [Phycicoccus sp.]
MSRLSAAELDALARRLRDEAVGVLSELSEGSSLCAIARSGRSFPAGRYHEGRMAAATLVIRARGSEPDADAALARATDAWAHASPAARRVDPGWQAYGEGGDDVLGELAEAASRPTGR